MLPRWTAVDLFLLVLVLAVAGATRVWYVSECAEQGKATPALQVQGAAPRLETSILDDRPPLRGQEHPTEFDNLVDNLTREGRFASRAPLAEKEEETAHVAPGYAWLVAAIGGLTDTWEQADQIVRWLQVLLGTLTAAAYFFFARRAFSSLRVGFLTGLFCALHPFWIINTAEIADGVLVTFLLGAVLMLGTRAAQVGGPFSSLLYGLGLAGLAMVRAALLPFAVIGLLWFLLRCRTVPRGWFCAVLAFLGFANGLAPWTVRNWQAYGEIIPVADSAFLHLWIGNTPQATGGPMDARQLRDTLPADRLAHLMQEPNQARRYRKLGTDVWEAVAADPAGAAARRLWAGLYFVFGENWFTQHTLTESGRAGDNPASMPDWLAERHHGLLIGALFGMLLLGFLGWRFTYAWRASARLATLALLWILLPYLLSHADSLSGPRLPLDGVLLCFSAFALASVLPGGAPLRNGPEEELRP
jgi:4-amino-4-deoxy-L-arabinose transferase-like glycosyltransferase